MLDRGYPSFLLMATLADMGVPYVMRCQHNFMNAEFGSCEAAGGDLELDLELTYPRLQAVRRSDPGAWAYLMAREPLRVRCVLVDVGGEAPEKLVTTIGAGELAASDLAEVYHMRWGVEICFEFMKDRLQMENFTGARPRLIEQDVYATAYLVNVAFDLANEAEREAAGDIAARGYKHAMAVNRTVAIGVLKEELMRLVTAPDDESREAMMADIVLRAGAMPRTCQARPRLRPRRAQAEPRQPLQQHPQEGLLTSATADGMLRPCLEKPPRQCCPDG